MEKIIQAASREALLSIDFVEGLALRLIRLGLPRRKVLDWLAELIFGWLEDGGVVVDEFGHDIMFDDETIDNAHGKDGTLRVISSIISYGRGKLRQRKPRVTMLSLLRVYDVAFKIAGQPVLSEARRAEAERIRQIVRSFSPVQRARYVSAVRKLRRDCQGERRAYYGVAVRRLRLRVAAEGAHWRMHSEGR